MEEVTPARNLKSPDSSAWFGAALAACVLFSALAALTFLLICRSTGGTFVYPLDDTYIHLTVAKMLALHGTWGISPDHFASASSAPGWTLLLTGLDKIAGVHLLTPLFINMVFAIGVVCLACATVRTFAPQAPAWSGFLITAAALGFAPLNAMWIMGMEHVAQIFAVLLLLWTGTRFIAGGTPRGLSTVCAAAALVTTIRYEGVFVVAAVALLLLLRQRWLPAVPVSVSGAIPVTLFGLYFHAKSGFYLPYSVIMKASYGLPGFRPLLSGLAGFGPLTGALVPLLIFLLAVRMSRHGFWKQDTTYGLLVVLIAIAHLFFARSGWLLRYEAYAVTALVLAVGILVAGFVWDDAPVAAQSRIGWRSPALVGTVTVVALLLSATVLMRRFWSGQKLTVLASVDRLNEHIQMANFSRQFYDNATVVLDDIGAVSYFANTRILDMAGLGSAEPVLPTRHGRHMNAAELRDWAEQKRASIAILQPGYEETRSRIPREWILIQTWQQPRNVVFQDLFTSFYAIRPAEIAHLCASLSDFKLIPADKVIFNACPANTPQARSALR